jgi:RNA polymerase sigma-70 factor (ECF subfamily)
VRGFTRLLGQARAGDQRSLGELLESYRNYLRLLARTQMGAALAQHLSASDLVQETVLDALRGFGGFLGTSEPAFLAWLRRILVRNVVDQVKRQRARKRGGLAQQSLDALLEQAHPDVLDAFAVSPVGPSDHAERKELSVLLADALAALPPLDREIIIQRQLEHQPFKEIANRVGRSESAVRVRWLRALEKLKRLLKDLS